MKYTLQISDIINSFREILGGSPSELVGFLTAIAIPAVFVISGIIIGFFVYRSVRDKFDYVGIGQRLGRYKIEVMGKYPLEGNLSVHDSWGARPAIENFEDPKIKDATEKVFEMIEQGKLFAYYLKITDDSDVWDKFRKSNAKNTIVISTGKLESDEYSWVDQKGERTITSVFQKEYPRRIVAYHTSERFEITNEDGNLDEYWIVNPIPKAKRNSVIIGGMNMDESNIIINVIEDARGISTVGSFMASLNESLSKKKSYELHIDHYNKILEDKDNELMKKNSKIQKLKYDLTQKPYIVYGTETKPIPPKSELIWMFIFWIAGLSGYAIIPEIPQLAGKIDPLLASVAGVIVCLVVKSLLTKKKPIDEDEEQ